MSENKNIKISDLVLNTGQIEGLPKNPRFIRNERFESLKKSIQDAPEMLDYRRLAVYPFNGKYVILCGNMRFRACKELGYKEMPCYVLPTETPAKVLREWVVKDNVAFGEIDTELLTEWDATELQEWGMELPNFGIEDEEQNPYTGKTEIPQYDVKGETPLLTDLYDTNKSEDLIIEIENSQLDEGEKKFLIAAAARHTIFNYRNIAEYYAQATPEMQRLMEKSALVIIDLENAIANGYAECCKAIEDLRKAEKNE